MTEHKSNANSIKLREIEAKIQSFWQQHHIFEADPPTKMESNTKEDQPKYMATFPYPYMNGRLHLGHAFTLSKIEFATQYQRQLGKNVLFPFAFHATGMPIAASAEKIGRELATGKASQSNQNIAAKLAAKECGSQIDTMLSMGIDRKELIQFQNPHHWVDYFIPKCIEDLNLLGIGIDWRRQFTTTPIDPIYDKFVTWQFRHLIQTQKIKYGKRYTIWSAGEPYGQPCMDHDRKTGEGVQPRHFTLVTFPFQNPSHISKNMAKTGLTIQIAVATVRPETVFGVSNLWIHPGETYYVCEHKFKDKTNYLIINKHCYNNLSHQDHCLIIKAELIGSHLINQMVINPYVPEDAKNRECLILPMDTILKNKGTGIVMSVPTESPDDYLMFRTFQNKKHPQTIKLLEKYTIPETVTIEMYPIIEVNQDTKSAETFCQERNLKNVNALSSSQLREAKIALYTNSQTNGIFIASEWKGRPVVEAIPEMKEKYIQSHQWYNYAEPESEVISRTGDICVVALRDQWYLDYGEPQWKEQLERHLQKMEFYSDKLAKHFDIAKDWMKQWACSRNFGLGSLMPDQKNTHPPELIDSLSDSTIYMALYTVYHHLKQLIDNIKSSDETSTLEKLNWDGLFDAIFLEKEVPDTLVSFTDQIQKMRQEFNYWYPMDLRVSGKDLIQNHLLFCLYNHLAIWGDDDTKLPVSFRTNGHVTIGGQKMSKQLGNFITVSQIVSQYCTDAVRLALASGCDDPLNDANFEITQLESNIELKVVNASVLALYAQLEWVEATLDNWGSYSTGDMTFMDTWLLTKIQKAINETIKHMDQHNFNEAVITSFYGMIKDRNYYTKLTFGNYHQQVIDRWIIVFLALTTPFIPHLNEHCFQKYAQKFQVSTPKSVRFLRIPEHHPIDPEVEAKANYLNIVQSQIGSRTKMWLKKHKIITGCRIRVCNKLSGWQSLVTNLIQEQKKINPNIGMPELSQYLKQNEELQSCIKINKINFDKKVMPFVAQVIVKGESDVVFNRYLFLMEIRSCLETFYQYPVEIYLEDSGIPDKPIIEFY